MSTLLATTAAAVLLANTGHLASEVAGSGAGGSLWAGLLGPLLGLDHLLTPVWLGIWAGRLGGREMWSFPSAFLVGLVLGFTLGLDRPTIPVLAATVHFLTIASLVLVVGAALSPVRLPTREALGTIALIGGCHGYVHGTEVTAVQALWFSLGATASAGVLLALGLLGGWTLQKGA